MSTWRRVAHAAVWSAAINFGLWGVGIAVAMVAFGWPFGAGSLLGAGLTVAALAASVLHLRITGAPPRWTLAPALRDPRPRKPEPVRQGAHDDL